VTKQSFRRRLATSLRYRARLARTAGVRRRLAVQLRGLDREGYALISNNCVAGILYEFAELQKQTPTAGIFFWGQCFADFLLDLASGHADRWQNVRSDELTYNDERKSWEKEFGDNGALVFLHYETPELAVEKWNRRIERIKDRQLIAIVSLRDGITAQMIREPAAKLEHLFMVSEGEAGPADEVAFDLNFLNRFSDYLAEILCSSPGTRRR
jgi:hypothetical protein